jgi:hypothetical protein
MHIWLRYVLEELEIVFKGIYSLQLLNGIELQKMSQAASFFFLARIRRIGVSAGIFS